jgi:hypothetical protein
MKHRSVIAFVIVAAALFSLPQLSNDLQALKGAVGARLHRELLHAFLSLPAGEPTSAVTVAGPSENLLASCTRKSDAKAGKGEASRRVEGRATGKTFEQSAMIGDPLNDPIKQVASAEVKEAADEVVASLPEVKAEMAEVAMIVPPDAGIDPRSLANTLVSTEVSRAEAGKLRAEADGLRVVYAARFDANGSEWQKATEDAVRKLNATLPGAYEFRVVRDGAKVKVLKFKCGDCPAGAPRLPLAPRRAPAGAPLPAPSAPAEWASE